MLFITYAHCNSNCHFLCQTPLMLKSIIMGVIDDVKSHVCFIDRFLHFLIFVTLKMTSSDICVIFFFLNVLTRFFYKHCNIFAQAQMLLNKSLIFWKGTLPYLTKRCSKCYLEREQSFWNSPIVQIWLFFDFRVSK